jgi:hypothetical protein
MMGLIMQAARAVVEKKYSGARVPSDGNKSLYLVFVGVVFFSASWTAFREVRTASWTAFRAVRTATSWLF